MEAGPDGHIEFFLVDPGDFRVETLEDVKVLWQELVRLANEYPGKVPIFKLVEDGS